MVSKLVTQGIVIALLASSAAAQDRFADYDWLFTTTGSAGSGSLTGPDELTLSSSAPTGIVTATAVALDTGRITVELAAQEWSGQIDYCGGASVAMGNTCVECTDFAWCVAPVVSEKLGQVIGATSTWSATWSIDVVEGECWQIALAQDPWSFECGSVLVASNLVFEPAPDVTLTSIDPTPAYKASLVTLTGTGMDAVDQVFVNGFETAILSQSTSEVVIRPTTGPAGFVDVELRGDSLLLASAPDGLTQWPAATAEIDAGALDVTVEAGLPGAWQLVLSLDTMPPASFGPATYGVLWLDVVGSPWLWLPGTLDANGHGELSLPLPQSAGLSGLTVHVQARTPAGFATPFDAAFTNVTEVVLP